MEYDASLGQQRIFDTGSVSGFHRVKEFGYGYLTQAKGQNQPLCRNDEGWGPISKYRYDLTPCALDATVFAVAAYGILFGVGAIYYLYKFRKEQEVKKDLHFCTKQVRTSSSLEWAQCIPRHLKAHWPIDYSQRV